VTDDELRTMLRSWQAPRAPDTLRRRVLPARWSALRWLLAGELRVPVPLALAALVLILFGGYRWLRPPTPASLSDFEQVTQFQPRIVRTVYETR
jgi:hypothetical protein